LDGVSFTVCESEPDAPKAEAGPDREKTIKHAKIARDFGKNRVNLFNLVCFGLWKNE
jgi:hypothetical protein